MLARPSKYATDVTGRAAPNNQISGKGHYSLSKRWLVLVKRIKEDVLHTSKRMSNGVSTNALSRPRFPLSFLVLEPPTAVVVSDILRFLLLVGFAGAAASLPTNSLSLSEVVSATGTRGHPFKRVEARGAMIFQDENAKVEGIWMEYGMFRGMEDRIPHINSELTPED